MQSAEAWTALGQLLARELELATDDATTRFASEIELRFQYFTTTPALRESVAKAVRTRLETRDLLLSYAGETRELAVRSNLHKLWEHVDAEYGEDPAETRWTEFDRFIHEELESVHAEGDRLIAALGSLDTQMANRRAWGWPLEPRGQLREVLADWRAAAAERMNIAPEALLDPASVRDRPVFVWDETATNVANLATWLQDRAAWARALHDLEPLVAKYRPS